MKTYRRIQSFVKAAMLTEDNAELLAKHCRGQVSEDAHVVTGEKKVMVLVPTLQGVERLSLGMMLVERDGRFSVEMPMDFLKDYEPLTRD